MDEQFGVTNDVDEKDMADFQLHIGRGLGRHEIPFITIFKISRANLKKEEVTRLRQSATAWQRKRRSVKASRPTILGSPKRRLHLKTLKAETLILLRQATARQEN